MQWGNETQFLFFAQKVNISYMHLGDLPEGGTPWILDWLKKPFKLAIYFSSWYLIRSICIQGQIRHAFVAILTNHLKLQAKLQEAVGGAIGSTPRRLADKEKIPFMEAVGFACCGRKVSFTLFGVHQMCWTVPVIFRTTMSWQGTSLSCQSSCLTLPWKTPHLVDTSFQKTLRYLIHFVPESS